MNPLEQFLGKISALMQKAAGSKKPFISTIKNISSIELTEKEVDIRHGIAYISASPLVKNEIFMRKTAILKELESVIGEPIRDIR